MAKESPFRGNYERRMVVESLMISRKFVQGDGSLSWYKLAKAMDKHISTVKNAFCSPPECRRDVNLSTIKAAALALKVPAGLLIDK